MSALQTLPIAVLALCPLALAAGLDLYLTLLFLGAAPSLPWWAHPLPGSLGDLGSAGVLVMAGGFYLLEVTAERWSLSAIIWNAFHAIIRPLAGALLALLVLDGQPILLVVAGVVVAAALASAAQTVRSGGSALLRLKESRAVRPSLVSAAEDVGVLGLLTLTLDRPTWAAALSLVGIVLLLPAAGTQARAFLFSVRLAWGRIWRPFRRVPWRGPQELPGWVRTALTEDPDPPDGRPRGAFCAAYHLPGAPRFSIGWIVLRGTSPAFVFRRWLGTRLLDLATLELRAIDEGAFFRRVDLVRRGGRDFSLFFGLGGPEPQSLSGELHAERLMSEG